MNIIKFKTANGWVSLYKNFLGSFLRKSKNLSDVNDKEKARINLELTGDNNHTHYHDDRYIPLINSVKDETLAQADHIRNELELKINNINTSVVKNDTAIETKMDKDLFCVGEVAPINPKDKTVWFQIKSNGEAYLKVWYNGQWNSFGAVWK